MRPLRFRILLTLSCAAVAVGIISIGYFVGRGVRHAEHRTGQVVKHQRAIQGSRYQAALDACLATDARYGKSTAFVERLARSETAKAKTPAQRAAIAQSKVQLDTLIDDLAPYVKDCPRHAAAQVRLDGGDGPPPTN